MVDDDKNKYVDIITSNVDLIVRFCSAENVDKGEDLYNVCDFCNYRTMHVVSDNMITIDIQIASHLYDKHRSEMIKKVNEYEAERIANAPGQQRLEVKQ